MQWKDLPAGLRLSSQAGWNQSMEDWQLIYDQHTGNHWVALKKEKIVATVTSINYSNRFDWVGMMVVDPTMHRQGIGRQLMEKVIAGADGRLVRLDASVMGARLYEKMGFKEEEKITRFICGRPSIKDSLQHHTISRIEYKDQALICTYDRTQTSFDRSAIIRALSERGQGWIFRSEQRPKGYLLTRMGRKDLHIGPVVADHKDIAESLLIHALHSITHHSIIIDVFNHSEWWINRLIKLGFAANKSFSRMRLGSSNEVITNQNQFAIMGPALS